MTNKTLKLIAIAPFFFVAVVIFAYLLAEYGNNIAGFRGSAAMYRNDWTRAFQPAALAFLSGKNPYDPGGFFNPPWVLLLLAPIALLPAAWGAAVMYAINLTSYLIAARILRVNFVFIAVAIAIMILISQFGNIEGLVVLGAFLPPWLGLFLVLAKPQVGIVVALLWFVNIWRKDGIILAVLNFVPVTTAFILSFVLYGFWPSRIGALCWDCNTSIFPVGIPIALIIIALALFKKNVGYALAAAPFLSPYVAMNTWFLTLFLFSRNKHVQEDDDDED